MTDATGRLAPELPILPETADPALRQRLLVVAPPPSRPPVQDGRPVTNLAAVFGRFAEIQKQFGDQVGALEDSIEQQKWSVADLAAQLPDMRERINWLIATYYEEDQHSQAIRERLANQEASLDALNETVRCLCEVQAQWKETIEQLLRLLTRPQTSPPAPPPQRVKQETLTPET